MVHVRCLEHPRVTLGSSSLYLPRIGGHWSGDHGAFPFFVVLCFVFFGQTACTSGTGTLVAPLLLLLLLYAFMYLGAHFDGVAVNASLGGG